MPLQDVIDQALSDPDFAQELKNKAMAGQGAGVDTDEWEEFMAYFAESPQQLAMFRTLVAPGGACTATTANTMLVTSTVPCTLTTTTLTTSVFCDNQTQGAEEA